MENSQKKETNRKVFRNFSIFGLIIIATFIIAGKIDWWNGWLFYGLYFLMMAFIGMNIAKKNPSLIKELYHSLLVLNSLNYFSLYQILLIALVK